MSQKNKQVFASEVMNRKVEEICNKIQDKELKRLFSNCFFNTLKTTINYQEKKGTPYTYVITGDIPAMWLRDSVAQVWPYLDFVDKDENIRKIFQGLINQQIECILLDPYANAFLQDDEGLKVFEKKWELDSLCYFIRLSYFYWKKSGDKKVFNDNWQRAIDLIIKTWQEQSDLATMGVYKYKTKGACPDILSLNGFGNPVAKSSLIRCAFRPSDDACIFQYLIPANCLAVVSLLQLAQMYREIFHNQGRADFFENFSNNINQDIEKYGIVKNLDGDDVFAYEVDAFGGQVLMDDSNIPSLLSLPYFDYLKTDNQVYKLTRKNILSKNNPYFFQGDSLAGIGSSHTEQGNIWPLGIIMQALTSANKEEIDFCLNILKNSHAGTYLMHESFSKNNPNVFTRHHFAWANSLFAELIMKFFAI